MAKLSTVARRARVLRWHREHADSVAATCRKFGISRATFYRWRSRYDPNDLRSLRPKSRRPRHTRPPVWALHSEVLPRLRELVEQYPRYGKRRLARLLAGQGIALSEATVGRLLEVVLQPCLVCGGSASRHDELRHAMASDLAAFWPQRTGHRHDGDR